MWIIVAGIAVTILFICCVRSTIKGRDERFHNAMWILATSLEVLHILDKKGPMTIDNLVMVGGLYKWEIEEAIESLLKGDCIIVNEKGEYQVKGED